MLNIIKKLITKRSKECNINISQGEEIYEVVFGKFFRHICSQIDFNDIDTFKSYRIQGFGVFYPNKKKAVKITENNKKHEVTSSEQ